MQLIIIDQLFILNGLFVVVRYCHFGVSPVNYSDSDTRD